MPRRSATSSPLQSPFLNFLAGLIFSIRTSSAQPHVHRIIALVTGILVQTITFFSLQQKRERPWHSEHRLVHDGAFILDRIGVDPRQALDEAHLAGAAVK